MLYILIVAVRLQQKRQSEPGVDLVYVCVQRSSTGALKEAYFIDCHTF